MQSIYMLYDNKKNRVLRVLFKQVLYVNLMEL